MAEALLAVIRAGAGLFSAAWSRESTQEFNDE